MVAEKMERMKGIFFLKIVLFGNFGEEREVNFFSPNQCSSTILGNFKKRGR